MGCFLHHRGVAQFGRVPALGAGCRRFESCRLDHFLYLIANWENAFLGPVAQLGERSVRIREVESSSLFRSTIELYFLSADQKLWGFISMKNSAKALKIPKRGRSSAGRAFDWQSRGHGFDPHRLHQMGARRTQPRFISLARCSFWLCRFLKSGKSKKEPVIEK